MTNKEINLIDLLNLFYSNWQTTIIMKKWVGYHGPAEVYWSHKVSLNLRFVILQGLDTKGTVNIKSENRIDQHHKR